MNSVESFEAARKRPAGAFEYDRSDRELFKRLQGLLQLRNSGAQIVVGELAF